MGGVNITKKQGGMGFRDLTIFNKALLAKQVWKMMTNPNTPIAQIFKNRYFKHMNIMEAQLGSNLSYVWRSLLWSRDALKEGTYWKIGKGDKVDIHNDRWIPDIMKGRVHKSTDSEDRIMVKTFLDNNGDWDFTRLANWCRPYKIEAIRNIHLTGINSEDKPYQIFEKKGQYSVKTGYWSAYNKNLCPEDNNKASSSHSNATVWDKIWNLQVPSKVKIFAWKTVNDIIGEEANLHNHYILIQPRCIICGFYWADTTHVLFYCQGIKKAWKESGWWRTLKQLKGKETKEILLHIEETSNKLDWDSFCMKM